MLKLLIRRLPPLVAACLLFTASAAYGAQASHDMLARTAAHGRVILGEDALEPQRDLLLANHSEAFRLRARASGVAAKARIYIDRKNMARTVVVGVYGNASGKPGALLSTGAISAPRGGAWNTVSLAPSPIVSARTYWLTVLGEDGTLRFRGSRRKRCSSDESAAASIGGLPASWSSGRVRARAHCPISAYVIAAVRGDVQPKSLPVDLNSLPGPTSPSGLTAPIQPAPPVEPPPAPAAPENEELPVVSGTSTVGHVLSTTNGSWSGAPTGFEYQWEDCDASGENCRTVSGATSSSYLVAEGDVGYRMRSIVTATNGGGSTSASSDATQAVQAPPPPPPPTNSALPLISGTTTQGQVLTSTNGTWSGDPTHYAYQWLDCGASGEGCAEIPEATASSYTLVSSDVGHTIRVIVSAENAGGSTPATSAATAVVLAPVSPPPVNTAVPTVSGTTTQGQTLSSAHGTWSGSPTGYAYQWQDCNSKGEACSNVGAATQSTYKLTESDVGYRMRVVVSATNAGGSTPASSAPTGAAVLPLAPANSVLPTISGTARQGQSLASTTGTWSEHPTAYTYQWQDCNEKGEACSSVSGATHSTYTLTSSDVKHQIRVAVTATNAAASTTAKSSATSTVLPMAPTNTALPTISGTTTEGQALSATNGTWSGSPTGYTYQWQDCNSQGAACSNVVGATHSTYTLASGDVGHKLRVVVTATNSGGSTPATSTATATEVKRAPPANTALPTITGTTTEGQTLSATNGTWNGSPTGYTYQWQDCNSKGEACSNVSGATHSTYTLASGDVKHEMRIVVTATNTGGSTPASSAATAEVLAVIPPAPVNTGVPAISGTTTQGQALSSTHGTWTNSPTGYTYQWEDCNSSGEACSDVSGATSSSYTLGAGDVGHTMRVEVTASNAGGSTPMSSAHSAEVTAAVEGTPYPACTKTLSTGANIPSAISSASNGEVICLNSGSYGHLTLNSTHSADVTLQAAPTAHVTSTAVTISGSHLVIRGLWIAGEVTLEEGASFITIDHDDISEGGEGIVFNTSNCKAPNAPEWPGCEPDEAITNVIISGNHIHDIGQPGTEDAIHLDNWRSVTITNNDFEHIIESGNHTDCMQSVYGGSELSFTENYEHDNDCQGFFVKDGDASEVSFTENLFLRDNEPDGAGEHFYNLAQFWNIEGLTIQHNTIWDGKGIVMVAEDAQNSPSAAIDHNLFSYFSISQPKGTAYSISESYNIFDESPQNLSKSSTDSINSKPSFDNTATDDYRLASNPNGIGIDWSPSEKQYGPTS